MALSAKLTRRLSFAALSLLLPLAGCYYPPYYYNGYAGYGGYYARSYGYGYGYGYAQPYGYGYARPYGYYGGPYRQGYYGGRYGYGYAY